MASSSKTPGTKPTFGALGLRIRQPTIEESDSSEESTSSSGDATDATDASALSSSSLKSDTPLSSGRREAGVMKVGGVKALGMKIGQNSDEDSDSESSAPPMTQKPKANGRIAVDTDTDKVSGSLKPLRTKLKLAPTLLSAAAKSDPTASKSKLSVSTSTGASAQKKKSDAKRGFGPGLKLGLKMHAATDSDVVGGTLLGDKSKSLRIAVPQRVVPYMEPSGSQTAPVLRIDTSSRGGAPHKAGDAYAAAVGPTSAIHRPLGFAVPTHRGPSTPLRMALPIAHDSANEEKKQKEEEEKKKKKNEVVKVKVVLDLGSPSDELHTGVRLAETVSSDKKKKKKSTPPLFAAKCSMSVEMAVDSRSQLLPKQKTAIGTVESDDNDLAVWLRHCLAVPMAKGSDDTGAVISSSAGAKRRPQSFWLYKSARDLNLLTYWRLKSLSADECHPLHFFAECWNLRKYKKRLKEELTKARKVAAKREAEFQAQRRARELVTQASASGRSSVRGSNSSSNSNSRSTSLSCSSSPRSASALSSAASKSPKSSSSSSSSSFYAATSSDSDEDKDTHRTPAGHRSEAPRPSFDAGIGKSLVGGLAKLKLVATGGSSNLAMADASSGGALTAAAMSGALTRGSLRLSADLGGASGSQYRKYHKEFRELGALEHFATRTTLTAKVSYKLASRKRAEEKVKEKARRRKAEESRERRSRQRQSSASSSEFVDSSAEDFKNGQDKKGDDSEDEEEDKDADEEEEDEDVEEKQSPSTEVPFSLAMFDSVPSDEFQDVEHVFGFVKSHSALTFSKCKNGQQVLGSSRRHSRCLRLGCCAQPSAWLLAAALSLVYGLSILERLWNPQWKVGLLDLKQFSDGSELTSAAHKSCSLCLAVSGRILLVSFTLLLSLPLCYLHFGPRLLGSSLCAWIAPSGKQLAPRMALAVCLLLVLPLLCHLLCLLIPLGYASLSALSALDSYRVRYTLWFNVSRNQMFDYDFDKVADSPKKLIVHFSIIGDLALGIIGSLLAVSMYVSTSALQYWQGCDPIKASEALGTVDSGGSNVSANCLLKLKRVSVTLLLICAALYSVKNNVRLLAVFCFSAVLWGCHWLHCCTVYVNWRMWAPFRALYACSRRLLCCLKPPLSIGRGNGYTVVSDLNVVPIDRHFKIAFFHEVADCEYRSYFLGKVQTEAEEYDYDGYEYFGALRLLRKAHKFWSGNGMTALLKHECLSFRLVEDWQKTGASNSGGNGNSGNGHPVVGSVFRIHATHFEGKSTQVSWNCDFFDEAIAAEMVPVLRGPYPSRLYTAMRGSVKQRTGVCVHIGIDEGVSYVIETVNQLLATGSAQHGDCEHVCFFATCSVALLRYVCQSLSLLFSDRKGLTVEARLSHVDFSNHRSFELDADTCEMRNVLGISHIETAMTVCTKRDVTVFFCGLRAAEFHVAAFCKAHAIQLISHCLN